MEEKILQDEIYSQEDNPLPERSLHLLLPSQIQGDLLFVTLFPPLLVAKLHA